MFWDIHTKCFTFYHFVLADLAFHGGGETGEWPEGDAQHHSIMWDNGILSFPKGLSRDLDLIFKFSAIHFFWKYHRQQRHVISFESDTTGNNWGLTSHTFLYEEFMILYLKKRIMFPLVRDVQFCISPVYFDFFDFYFVRSVIVNKGFLNA